MGTLLVLLGLVAAPAAPGAPTTEDEIKAAFVLNFPKYIEWAPEAFASPDDNFVLAVFGDRRFADTLRTMSQGRTYQGRSLVVQAVAELDEIASSCHIVFVGVAERRRIPDVLPQLKSRAVLTVGECDDFLAAGGMINLARHDRRIRLEVNLPHATAAGLKISSKLLGVAEVVQR